MSQLRHLEISDPRFEVAGLRHVTMTSPNLLGRGDVTLFVPPEAAGRTAVPLVILLHGVYGSHWAWAQCGGAHLTTARLIVAGEIPPLVLAMPSDGLWGEGSGYGPHSGRDFARWIVDDVPEIARLAGSGVTAASPQFLAGLSMGGFGALRLAARYPREFRGASGHSCVTDLRQLAGHITPPYAVPPVAGADRSVLATMLQRRTELPPFRFDCGTADELLPENRRLHAELLAAGIPHEYQEFPGGHHWPYWERHLADTLRFFARILPRG